MPNGVVYFTFIADETLYYTYGTFPGERGRGRVVVRKGDIIIRGGKTFSSSFIRRVPENDFGISRKVRQVSRASFQFGHVH